MPFTPARRPTRRLPRDERIAKILAVTRAMVSEMGYESVVTSEVAKRCGISEATIYKYFSSKRDLLMQVAEQWFEETLLEDQRGIQGQSALEMLRHVIWRNLSVMRREPALTRFLLMELRPDPAYRSMRVFELNRRFTAQVTDVLHDGMRTGELRDDVPVKLLRDMVFGAIEHHTWRFLRGEGDFDIDAVTAGIAIVIYRGMAAEPMAQRPAPQHDLAEAIARLERVAGRFEQSAAASDSAPEASTSKTKVRARSTPS